MPSNRLPRGLYAITDADCIAAGSLGTAVRRALIGGARVIQYRDPGTDHGRRVHEAAELRDICHAHDAPFLIARDVRLAQEIHADGVHLEDPEADLGAARNLLGDEAIIGVSCLGSLPRAIRAVSNGADYVSFGCFFPSVTEPGAPRANRTVLADARERLDVPIVAIGGVTPANGIHLINAGADLLAAISGVFAGRDPEGAAHHYAALFDSHSHV